MENKGCLYEREKDTDGVCHSRPKTGGGALSADSKSKSSVVSSLLSSMVCFTTVEKKWKFASGNTAHCFNVLMLMESYMQIDVSAELQSVILVQATSQWESLSREGSSFTVLTCLKIFFSPLHTCTSVNSKGNNTVDNRKLALYAESMHELFPLLFLWKGIASRYSAVSGF